MKTGAFIFSATQIFLSIFLITDQNKKNQKKFIPKSEFHPKSRRSELIPVPKRAKRFFPRSHKERSDFVERERGEEQLQLLFRPRREEEGLAALGRRRTTKGWTTSEAATELEVVEGADGASRH